MTRTPSWARRIAACLIPLLVLQQPLGYAASTSVSSSPLNGVLTGNTLDLTVNVDWDYDASPPVTQIDAPSTVLDRAAINTALNQFAKSFYTMTEGKLRVANLYVYRNSRFGKDVDIQLVNSRRGRSNGSVAGLGKSQMTTTNYLTGTSNGTDGKPNPNIPGTPESLTALGKVLAHELGHYVLGLSDEYNDSGTAPNPNDPGAPTNEDTPRNTLMNNQEQFQSLSTQADYADPAQRKTAHFRVHNINGAKGSAWDTLTRAPANDPPVAKNEGRYQVLAFSDVNPDTVVLTRPALLDAQLPNIVYVPNPQLRQVLIIDRNQDADTLADLVKAARGVVEGANAPDQLAIVASPAPASGGVIAPLTTTDAAGKQALNNALTALQSGQGTAFDGTAAFNQALGLLPGAASGDPRVFHLVSAMTSDSKGTVTVPAPSVASDQVARLRDARVKLNLMISSFTSSTPGASKTSASRVSSKVALERRAARKPLPAGQINLAELAQATGGKFLSANSSTQAERNAMMLTREANLPDIVNLAIDGADTLAANQTQSTRFFVGGNNLDGEVRVVYVFDPADAAKLSFSLTTPAGANLTPSSLPVGVDFTRDNAEGYAEFTIATTAAGRTGAWAAKATASAAVSDGVGIDVETDSNVAVGATLAGGSVSLGVAPRLLVTLGNARQITGARVTANIYDEYDALVLGNVALADNGQGPDSAAGDGIYSADLTGRLPAGEYVVVVNAVGDNSSMFARGAGHRIQGALEDAVPTGAFERTTATSFFLQEGAPGVTAAATDPGTVTPPTTTSSGGGGCTVNPGQSDFGLLMLLAAALAVAWLRRRQPR